MQMRRVLSGILVLVRRLYFLRCVIRDHAATLPACTQGLLTCGPALAQNTTGSNSIDATAAAPLVNASSGPADSGLLNGLVGDNLRSYQSQVNELKALYNEARKLLRTDDLVLLGGYIVSWRSRPHRSRESIPKHSGLIR